MIRSKNLRLLSLLAFYAWSVPTWSAELTRESCDASVQTIREQKPDQEWQRRWAPIENALRDGYKNYFSSNAPKTPTQSLIEYRASAESSYTDVVDYLKCLKANVLRPDCETITPRPNAPRWTQSTERKLPMSDAKAYMRDYKMATSEQSRLQKCLVSQILNQAQLPSSDTDATAAPGN